jgi:DNA-binding NarL/FixJ family response regulator
MRAISLAYHLGLVARLRVMVVDDHRMILQALTLALSKESDIEVVATAGTVAEGVAAAAEANADVLLIDYHLPDGTGVDLVHRLSRPGTGGGDRAGAKTVFLSSDKSDEAVLAALEAGACGYLLKSEPLDRLVAAVRRAHEGEILLPPGELVSLLSKQRERRRQEDARQQIVSTLTDRERQIIELMAQGLDNRSIAADLHLALTTVRWYVNIILEKLEVHSKLSAVARAAELGLVNR